MWLRESSDEGDIVGRAAIVLGMLGLWAERKVLV